MKKKLVAVCLVVAVLVLAAVEVIYFQMPRTFDQAMEWGWHLESPTRISIDLVPVRGSEYQTVTITQEDAAYEELMSLLGSQEFYHTLARNDSISMEYYGRITFTWPASDGDGFKGLYSFWFYGSDVVELGLYNSPFKVSGGREFQEELVDFILTLDLEPVSG